MTSRINRYRLYCQTEAQWTYQWSETPPTVCPNVNTHVVNPNSLQLLQTVANSDVTITSEKTATGGHFRATNVVLAIPANGSPGDVTYSFVQFPFAINLSTVLFSTDFMNIGDQVSATINPESEIGTITNALSIGSSQCNLTTLTPNIAIGFVLGIYASNGVFTSLGYCTNIDFDNKTVSFSSPLSTALGSGGMLVASEVMLDNYLLSSPAQTALSASNLLSRYWPPSTVGRIAYKNNSTDGKSFVMTLTYFY